MVSKNGSGKTTLLDTMACLISLLGQTEPRDYGQEDLDFQDGRAQLDLKLKVYWRGQTHYFLLSILAGSLPGEFSLKAWDDQALELYGLSKWHRIGFSGRKSSYPLKPFATHKMKTLLPNY